MTDKEIIIDGMDILGTIDDWADTISQEWNCDEYSTAKIIKSYILDINKQLRRKEQECKELKRKNVLLQNHNQQLDGAITEAASYKQALEKIEEIIHNKSIITYEIRDIKTILNEVLKCK